MHAPAAAIASAAAARGPRYARSMTTDFAAAREAMVAIQLERRGISDQRLLAAMRAVPREAFVSAVASADAYADGPLPIGEGQTISQPYVVALMIEAAAVKPDDRVLEVGAGSGYAAAILGHIAAHVHAIERRPALAAAAAERLARLGIDNVSVQTGDGSVGWPEAAPFDAILVAAAGPQVPEVLKSQLAVGGRLVMPVGRRALGQSLLKVTRRSEVDFEQQDLGGVSFVPLIGAGGWKDER
jgi:protein-L-isoaspartate(D-aspartate) O-methyltransferase